MSWLNKKGSINILEPFFILCKGFNQELIINLIIKVFI